MDEGVNEPIPKAMMTENTGYRALHLCWEITSFNLCHLQDKDRAGPLLSQDGGGPLYKMQFPGPWDGQLHIFLLSLLRSICTTGIQFPAEWECYLRPEFSLSQYEHIPFQG